MAFCVTEHNVLCFEYTCSMPNNTNSTIQNVKTMKWNTLKRTVLFFIALHLKFISSEEGKLILQGNPRSHP